MNAVWPPPDLEPWLEQLRGLHPARRMHGQSGFNPWMAAIAGGAILSLFVLESRWPLRARVESRLRRVTRNASVGLLGGVIVNFGVLSAIAHAATFAQVR